MNRLSGREKILLLACCLVVFTMANLIGFRIMKRNWGGGSGEIKVLESELADLEMWLDEADRADQRDRWLRSNIPRETSMTRAQGDLLQSLQDDLFERKIKIEKQSLKEPEMNDWFQSVAVSLRVRGSEKSIIEWLTTLQGAKKFQVIERLELELDRKSKEKEPQMVCEIILARWFAPLGEEPYEEATEDVTQAEAESSTSGS